MPYDSNGNFSLAPGYLAVAGQVIQPSQHNPPLEDVSAGLSLALVRDGRAAMTGNLNMGGFIARNLADGALVTDAATKGQLGILSVKAGNYTAVLLDYGVFLRFTATATLSLTAAATLGANWRITVIADGGSVTIDPNGSETINGLTTIMVPNGTTATIICDGTSFYTYIRAAAWEAIGNYTLSAVSSFDVTNLGAYSKLRITGNLTMSASSNVIMRFSADNGATFDSATSYPQQALLGTGSTASAAASSLSGAAFFPGTPDANLITSVNTNIESFNKFTRATISSMGSFTASTALVAGTIHSQYVGGLGGRNAIRILPFTAGTITGSLLFEGYRG